MNVWGKIIVLVGILFLPFAARGEVSKEEDFVWAQRGLIAEIKDTMPPIDVDDRRVNSSLLRQAKLNAIKGLFQVTERIYQVRGIDLANLSIVVGEKGYIVIDPLSSADTARAAIDLVYEKLGRKPISAVIYSHSHVDHWGGVLGIVERGSCPVIAPVGFMREVVRENILAGNAMARRASYMYGIYLPSGPSGWIDNGLGKSLPAKMKVGLIAPSQEIKKTGEELTIDGVKMVFQLTYGVEAPSNMHIFFPQLRALYLADSCVASLHNFLTPRGAQVRDASAWANHLEEAWTLFGHQTDVIFLGHTWPRWGKENIFNMIKKQADAYRYIHDQTLRLINQGYTIADVGELVKLPPELDREWFNRPYYATVGWNARAVYQYYLGWFDGNPIHLNPLPPREAALKYVSYMGGSDKIMDRARKELEEGHHRWVAEVMYHVVTAEPENDAARRLLAEALERMGFREESAVFRNFYLSGAYELRYGIQEREEKRRPPIEIIRALSLHHIFEAMAIRLNGPRAAGKKMKINWVLTDTGEKVALVLENGVLHHYPGKIEEDAECTLKMTRDIFDRLIAGETTPALQFLLGRISWDGKLRKFWEFMDLFDEFNPSFSLMIPPGR
ncbi:MAG: MBL fold metallo-hydrolase [Syntrophales bacterium]|nr:MBL fold metallo-hydrolase [Syntrophales bacterium]